MTPPNDAGEFGPSSPVERRRSTVLIIDDDDSIRTLSQWVAQRAGYPVLTARDGPEGLASFQRDAGRVGLILLDLTMPRMTGSEVLAAFQQLGISVPILLITGYGEDALREDERVGVCGIIQKPFTPETLRGLLAQYLAPPVVPLKQSV